MPEIKRFYHEEQDLESGEKHIRPLNLAMHTMTSKTITTRTMMFRIIMALTALPLVPLLSGPTLDISTSAVVFALVGINEVLFVGFVVCVAIILLVVENVEVTVVEDVMEAVLAVMMVVVDDIDVVVEVEV